jgi:hypothetical protein
VGDGVLGEHLAVEVLHQLFDLDRHAPVRRLAEADRLDARVDHRPLARPVVADLGMAVDAAALPAVGPVDIRVHLA